MYLAIGITDKLFGHVSVDMIETPQTVARNLKDEMGAWPNTILIIRNTDIAPELFHTYIKGFNFYETYIKGFNFYET